MKLVYLGKHTQGIQVADKKRDRMIHLRYNEAIDVPDDMADALLVRDDVQQAATPRRRMKTDETND